jgi:hypothetical protein
MTNRLKVRGRRNEAGGGFAFGGFGTRGTLSAVAVGLKLGWYRSGNKASTLPILQVPALPEKSRNCETNPICFTNHCPANINNKIIFAHN